MMFHFIFMVLSPYKNSHLIHLIILLHPYYYILMTLLLSYLLLSSIIFNLKKILFCRVKNTILFLLVLSTPPQILHFIYQILLRKMNSTSNFYLLMVTPSPLVLLPLNLLIYPLFGPNQINSRSPTHS